MTKVEPQNRKCEPWADFFLDRVIGSSAAIRLINSGCEWIKEISGKTNFIFFGCTLDIAAFSKNCLKPLDNQLSIVKVFAGGFALREKYYKVFPNKDKAFSKKDIRHLRSSPKKSNLQSRLELIEQIFKTTADLFGGIQFISTFGAMILSSYTHRFGLVKNCFKMGAGLLTVVLRTSEIWKLLHKNRIQKEERLEILGHIAMIVAQTFSIQLNLFGACCSAFKNTQVPSYIFNFLGTCSSLTLLTYSGIEYARGK